MDVAYVYVIRVYLQTNMYIVKITCIMPHRGNNIKNVNINPREITNFRKCAEIHRCDNIYVYSILQ